MRPLILGCLWVTACNGPDTEDPEPDAFGVLAEEIPGGVLLSAWSDGDDVRMVGGQLDGTAGLVVVYDGEGVCSAPLGDHPLWWIHGSAPGNWTAVGEGGTILHSVDGVVTDESVATDATLFGVWDAGDEAWAVGGDVAAGTGEVWKRVGGVWGRVATADRLLFKVWNDWVVGVGFAGRLVADALVDQTPPGAPRLLTVRGASVEDVWAVGGDAEAALWHWRDEAWEEVTVDPFCGRLPLNGVWTGPGEGVWLAGMSGTVGGLVDGAWVCPDFPPTLDHLHAAWKHGDEVLFVGGDLFARGDNHGVVLRHPAPAAPVAVGACP